MYLWAHFTFSASDQKKSITRQLQLLLFLWPQKKVFVCLNDNLITMIAVFNTIHKKILMFWQKENFTYKKILRKTHIGPYTFGYLCAQFFFICACFSQRTYLM